MPTINGNGWDLLHPSPDIDWMNVAGALAKICRFNGQCQSFYSVAQHCSLVASLMPPQWRLYGLLHFEHESPDEWRHRLFDLIKEPPNLDWQTLTKRPKIEG